MAVPNTNSFTMIDVCIEMSISSSGRSLQELFLLSYDSGFDPLYKGSKNNLLNFRNYSHEEPKYINALPQSLLFTWNGTVTQEITVNSNTNWYVDLAGTQTWAFVSPSSGFQNGTLFVSVSRNNTSIERTTTFYIRANGNDATSVGVTITQQRL